MSSDHQIAANRINAQRSTGPRTAAGKASVSSNALKHGLTGRDIVLPSENPEEFESFRMGLLSSLDPVGELEGVLAEKIVDDAWRLRRVPIFEATLHRRGDQELRVRQAVESVRESDPLTTLKVLKLLDEKLEKKIEKELEKEGVAAPDRQAHEDAKLRLARARAELDDPAFSVARVLETSSKPLSNLWRHEGALFRSWLKAMHELERLQARRAGEQVAAPAVVDVNVSLSEPPPADIGGNGPNEETDDGKSPIGGRQSG